MGVSVFQVLDVGETVVREYKHTGVLTIAFNAVDQDDIYFEAVSGVVRDLRQNQNGQWAYSIDATNLEAGNHPYLIRARNTKTGEAADFEGTVLVVAPLAVVDVPLTNEGKRVDVGQEVIQFSANNLSKNTNVKIVAAPSSAGVRYIIQSDLALNDYGVKISFPRESANFDLYNVLNENSSILRRAANGFQLGLSKLTAPESDGEKINTEPYKKDTAGSLITSQGVSPIIKKGLGSIVLQGRLNTYSESRLLQSAFIATGSAVGGVGGGVVGERGYQAASNAIFQRHWDNTDDAFSSDGSIWGDIKDAAGNLKKEFKFDRRPSFELHSSVVVDPRLIDWSKYEPVLFVHGFAPTIGGGESTWNKFPKLALQTQLPNGKTLIPFEFHWYTTQSFRLAANDLGEAVNYISNVSGGQKVHIVAHSFGGVLTRTLLQGLSKNPALANGARNKVASLTSVGSPYSGILQKPKVLDGVQLPMGNFDIGSLTHIINTCISVTCYEMGGAPLIDDAYTDKSMEKIGLFGDYVNPGQLVSQLNNTEAALPELPIYHGIGIVKKPGETSYQDGDWLISFSGQRFRTGSTPDLRDKNARPLFDEEMVGQAKVTEVILGELPTVRPFESVVENKLPSLRPRGYLHSSATGNGNWFGTDGGDKQTGLMAAPDALCDIPATCEHAGYLLLRQALNDKFTFSNREYDRTNQLPAGAISVRKNITLSDAQKIRTDLIINYIRAKGLISGGNINWNKLNSSDRLTVWQMMNGLPNDETVTTLLKINTLAASGMGDYYQTNLKSFNATAAGEGLWGDGALKDWMKVAEAELKGVTGILTVAYPGSAMAASTGATAIRNTSVVKKIAKRIKLLTQAKQWSSVANNCGFQNPIEYEAALERIIAGQEATKSDLEAVVLKPLNCVASGLQFGSENANNWGTLISLLTARYELEDGQIEEGLQLALSIIDAAVGLVPESVAMTQTKGVLDVGSAFVDAYVAGQAMSERANTSYLGKFYEFDERAKSWDDKYLAERTQILLTAKGNYLFVINYDTPDISVDPSNISTGQAALISISNAWESIQNVIYDIGGRITSVARSAADTVSKAFGIEWVFDVEGAQTVKASYVDKDGASLGSSTLEISTSASPAPSGDFQLADKFNGSELNSDVWNIKGTTNCGGHQVSGSLATFYGGAYADTQDKKTFTGKKIVIEALMGGTQGNRDTHFELVDVATGQTIQVGDTNDNATVAAGLYLATNPGSGKNDFDQRGIEATSAKLQAYRLTLQGQTATLERGDSFTGAMSSHTFTLPRSIAGKTFYLRVGTGAADCVYSPGTFDSIKVTTESVLTNELFDDFNGDALDLTKWSSAGYAYEVNANTSVVGSFSVGNGVIDLGSAGGVATFGKQHFKGHKIVVEARVARTGAGEFPIALVNTQDINDRITIGDTGYCNVGFLGGVAGRFQFSKKYPFCSGSGYGLLLGKPAAVGEWMEYRLTVDGNKFTMERGPTLNNITQSATETLNLPIDPFEWFLYFRTGSSGGYYGAKFDWIRVNVTPSVP
jgi:pimeloyl-ACP methyl ester carboxylesterase